MTSQPLNELSAILVEIRDHLATIANAAQVMQPSDNIRIIQAESITKGVDDNGKTSYKVRGHPFSTYGVCIWPEVLHKIGVKEADLQNGPNDFNKPVQVLMVQGKPKKVIGLVQVARSPIASAPGNSEPHYEPPVAPPEEKISF